MSRTDVDDFLDRSAAVLAEPDPLATCAWCAHPLDETSPSGEFCKEGCAASWRAGLDWFPEERCACRTCDPDGPHHRGRGWFDDDFDELPVEVTRRVNSWAELARMIAELQALPQRSVAGLHDPQTPPPVQNPPPECEPVVVAWDEWVAGYRASTSDRNDRTGG